MKQTGITIEHSARIDWFKKITSFRYRFIIYSGTSMLGSAKGLAKFVHFNEVSLPWGSFPKILLFRVPTLFWAKNSRTFQGLSRTRFPFSKDFILCKKGPWVYVFFSSTTAWAILSWRSFILGTSGSGLDKVSTEIQGLSNQLQFSRTFNALNVFYFHFKDFQGAWKPWLLLG